MTEENIWESLNLSDEKVKTAYDYLNTQTDNFNKATKSVLSMTVEVANGLSASKSRVVIYYLYIVAPYLGNFRKLIMHVEESVDIGRFPVNLISDVADISFEDVPEQQFLSKVKEILAKQIVINIIENLYRQSLEGQKRQLPK